MASLLKLALFVAIAASTRAQFSSYQPQYTPEATDEEALTIPEYIAQGSQKLPTISLQLQLPKEEAPLPFYTDEPSSYLNVPVQNAQPQPNFYEYPIPSQDLKAPSQEAWNPNNDPNLYFEILKSEEPTNLYPKKFSKDIHSKEKPISSKPKEEITLVPLTEQEFVYKKNKFDKTLLNLAKVNNQKLVQAEKVELKKLQNNKNDKKNAKISDNTKKAKSENINTANKENAELAAESTAFLAQGELQHLESPIALHHAPQEAGVAAHFAGAPHPSDDRVIFQMHGHAGPHTYKWGFDTGKGHNRHFRYEERDKHGVVKGQYGFYDKHGKLQVVHYDSHPHEGFHAENNFGKA